MEPDVKPKRSADESWEEQSAELRKRAKAPAEPPVEPLDPRRDGPLLHTVRSGDCTASVAHSLGRARETVWNEAANEELVKKRKDAYLLDEGDALVIPERRPRKVSRATGASHVFRLEDVPERLEVVLLDADGRPREGVRYVIDVGGEETEGELDGGAVRVDIRPDERESVLVVEEEDGLPTLYHLELGQLAPADEPEGARSRLLNLGYLLEEGPPLEEDPEQVALFVEALAAFQEDEDLEPTGELDEPTAAALARSHGC